MWCDRYPGCGCGTQSGPHACEGTLIRQTIIDLDGITIKRPAADPPGFDRDGLATGPSFRVCRHCGALPGADHKFDCAVHQIKPRPITKGAVYSDRCKQEERHE